MLQGEDFFIKNNAIFLRGKLQKKLSLTQLSVHFVELVIAHFM